MRKWRPIVFLIRYLKTSFTFKNIFQIAEEKFSKVLVYFVIVCFLAIFPMSLMIINEGGQQIDFILEDFNTAPAWALPNDCEIRYGAFVCQTNEEYTFYHDDVTYIFNYQSDTFVKTAKQILFKEDRIIYTDGNGAFMRGNYGAFGDTYRFSELNLATDRTNAYKEFGSHIEAGFSDYIILFSLLTSTGVSFIGYFLFVFLLGIILQLFKKRYSTFFSYLGGVKIVMVLTAIPALVSAVIGLFAPAFNVVIFNVLLAVIVMYVMIKIGSRELD